MGMENLKTVQAGLLPTASSVTDADMILIVQTGRLKRALPSAMKGERGEKGDKGDSVQLRSSGGSIQYKIGANGAWEDLFDLSDIKGDTGLTGQGISYKWTSTALTLGTIAHGGSDVIWGDSVELKGEKGDTGLTGQGITHEWNGTRLRLGTIAAGESSTTWGEYIDLKGDQGEQGEQGIQGIQGIQGEKGDKGDSVSLRLIETAIQWKQGDGDWQDLLHLSEIQGEKGEPGKDGIDGETPVFETGTITTADPGTQASATVEPAGTTADGRPLYRISMAIPRGQQGLPGEGSGNVSASGDGLLIGKRYLFVPDSDGSTSGKFVEYTDPDIPSKTSELENDSGFTTESAVAGLLSGYVQKVAGKGLSTEDFTTELKEKLSGLSNYDDASIQQAVASLQEQLDTILSGNASTAIESFNEIIAFLENVEDTETLDGIMAGINTTIANVQASVPTKLSQLTNDNDTVTDANYVHTDNNFTAAEKEKLASLGNGGDSNDYIVTIATSDKQLYKAGADTMDQATAETFLGPIDDLLAAIDAGKRIYIHNVEAKKLTELKAVYIGNFYSLLSIWADDSSSGSVINLTTSILSSKDVTNYGYRTGYTYASAGEILVGGGAQQDYSLSGDQTFTLVPDSFIPIRGCTTTMIISTLKDHSANITIEKHSSITDNMVVIGDNPFEIPANSAVEISVLYTNLANKGTYVVRYSEPFTRPS